MIKGERGQHKPLSKRLLEIDGRVATRQEIEVRSVSRDSRLSTVQEEYAVVKKQWRLLLNSRSSREISVAKSLLTQPASSIESCFMTATMQVAWRPVMLVELSTCGVVS